VFAFRGETAKLRGYLPLAQSAQLSRIEDKMGTLTATIQDHDAHVLGLVKHAELLELNEKGESDFTDANEMKGCNVKVGSKDSELSAGTVEFVREGSRQADTESVMIELKHYPPPDECDGFEGPDPDTEVNVRRLAGLLKISASGTRELRTLPFKYYVHQPREKRYAFVFGYPLHAQQTQPQSLHELIKLSSQEKRFPLGTRFQVAKAIAQSIGVFHADGWVHKSVCSQSVVFFKDRTKESLMLESPYLVDFGYSRPEEGRTYAPKAQTIDDSTLYLHPDRPRMTFTKLHDVYALGIVLLEIATWKVAQDHFQSAIGDLDMATARINKEEVREKFVSIARRSIPYHMGLAYMEAVVACLDDTFRGQTGTAEFVGIFQSEVIEKLSAKQLVL
jgi:serine/threonine protein kinase